MTTEERLKSLEDGFLKTVEEAAAKYSDIKILFDDYKKLKEQPRWTEEFLDGYLSCISDLIIVKKMI
jgi:hypothetical protein